MVKVGIFGVGSIGSLLAKYLEENNSNQCYFFNRQQKEKTKIVFNKQLSTISLNPINNYNIELDWLIVCLKAYHYHEAMTDLRKLTTPKTKVAIFRNGLELSSNFQHFVSKEKILETIIDCSVQLSEDGNYIQYRKPIISIPSSTLGTKFIKLFALSDIDFIMTESFQVDQWKKLIESASLGSIQCLTSQPCVVFKDHKWLKIYKELINEGIKVAQSEGISLSLDFKLDLLQKLKKYPDDKGSSMLMDKLSGKQIELEAKTGAIVKIANKNGISVPYTLEIYNSLLI